MAYSKKLNLIFIHVPKCAGTSIIEAMRAVDSSVKHGHSKWSDHVMRDITTKKPTSFGIVRNPWDRVFSCYNYARKSSSYWHGKGGIYGVHRDYELLSKYNFKDCIKILYKNRRLLDKPPHDRPHFQHNWDKQHPYLYKKHELQVDHVLRFERIDEVADWLHTLYGLTIPKINVSTDGEDYIKHYDDEMVDLVGKIYEEDVRILGYNFGD